MGWRHVAPMWKARAAAIESVKSGIPFGAIRSENLIKYSSTNRELTVELTSPELLKEVRQAQKRAAIGTEVSLKSQD